MDDFILFAREKAALQTELAEIQSFLESNLALALKDNIQLNRSRFGVPFLGFRVFPVHIRLNPRSRRFSQKFREYERNFLEGAWTERDLIRHAGPLVEFTNAGDSRPFRRSIMSKFSVIQRDFCDGHVTKTNRSESEGPIFWLKTWCPLN